MNRSGPAWLLVHGGVENRSQTLAEVRPSEDYSLRPRAISKIPHQARSFGSAQSLAGDFGTRFAGTPGSRAQHTGPSLSQPGAARARHQVPALND